jgi:hypothetical protein
LHKQPLNSERQWRVWFNRKFDIEKKPQQSIGLVAGALVAIVFWAAAIARWMAFSAYW